MRHAENISLPVTSTHQKPVFRFNGEQDSFDCIGSETILQKPYGIYQPQGLSVTSPVQQEYQKAQRPCFLLAFLAIAAAIVVVTIPAEHTDKGKAGANGHPGHAKVESTELIEHIYILVK